MLGCPRRAAGHAARRPRRADAAQSPQGAALIRSRDNPKVKRWARLVQDGRFRREEGRTIIEGPHLVEAALGGQVTLEALLVSEDAGGYEALVRQSGKEPVMLPGTIFRAIVDTETPQGIAAEISIPRTAARRGDSVFLEGVQDAGNVGAIIRSAAAFGLGTVYLDKACADAWSPKVLRAGAGAHFALSIVHAAEPPDMRLVCAVAHGGESLRSANLAGPICWVFGAEGSGISRKLQARADVQVTIGVSSVVESLNVAAAAAVCFFEAFSRRGRGS